ncbi:hypothetical protein SAY86_010514 [Trapa natans]|uniref:Uncharacterized protein n=1 Tax=Trapa natans TaxID=22666 RepID=A0AAN7LW48_TRANT|nr:hypothetical protein SAY86_010514 [Trapa natans]
MGMNLLLSCEHSKESSNSDNILVQKWVIILSPRMHVPLPWRLTYLFTFMDLSFLTAVFLHSNSPGLLRCGKSCRLRWINYLQPDIKRGNFTREEEDTIIRLHQILGNRWSAIASKLPGRTDNEIKNVWHTHLKKRLQNKQNVSSSPKQLPRSARKPEPSSTHLTAMSPQLSSSEMSSITQTSMKSAENNRSELKSQQPDIISMESFPLIDESFWTDPMSSVSSGESSESDPSTLNFSIDIDGSELLLEGSDNSPNIDGNMDLWYNLLVGSGDLELPPDFY